MRIVPATADDAAALAGAHAASAGLAYADIFPSTSTAPTPADLGPGWLAMILDPDCSVLAANLDGVVVGGVALQPDADVPTGRLLTRLYVHPNWWGSGAGSALLDRAIALAADESSALNLWVLEENQRARRMYERRGWTIVPGRYLANDPPDVKDVLYQLRL